ncbi:YncE family protein [Mycobacterium decipiens]|uniref:YncE family protein n=1 Tax=Mycobacterium decipiens TaxID=1430326 RepID=A0A1X2LP40_9MYCO|nr:YncE family protein [Mycobacterium decipiens]OSC37014.1 hypothetical protein B8W66_22065 [Mycobacterium decipiens]
MTEVNELVRVLQFGTTSAVVRIAVQNGPISGIDISPDGNLLLVTNYGSDTVSIIDTDTCRVTQTVTGVNEPFAVTMGNAEANRAYVSTVSSAYDAIAVIDVPTNAVIATHPLALSVSDLAVSPDGKYLYVSRNGVGGADVAALDTTTVELIDVADLAMEPGTVTECVRVSPDGSRLYVGTNRPSGGRLVVIATRAHADDAVRTGGLSRWRRKTSKSRAKQAPTALRVVDTIEIGASVRDVAVSPDGAVAYVASCGSDFGAVVDVIDTRTNKITSSRSIGEIGGLVTRVTISNDGARAYLVSEDRVTVLCTRTRDVIGTIRTNRPSCVVESPNGKHLYIADYSGTVTMTPVRSTEVSDIEQPRLPGQTSIERFLPELLQYEPASA